MLSFILPGLFNNYQLFTDWFNRPFEADSDSSDDDEDDDNPAQQTDCGGGDAGAAEEGAVAAGFGPAIASGRSKKKRKRVPKALKFTTKQPKAGVTLSSIISEEENALIVQSLHRVIKPFVLRRCIGDVRINLPPKVRMLEDAC